MARATCLVDLEAGACLGGYGPCESTQRSGWNFATQAANEQDSEKLMALIKQIAALLDTKQERLIEGDSQRLKSERID